MTCHECQAAVPAGARFCPACGTPQQRACVACGGDLPGGARFCPACGAPQSTDAGAPPTAAPHERVAARRVTSVLFGDLVGFTSLAEGRDHEDVRELLSRYFETSRRIVERFGGVVEKFIGDAVMAVWGVPTAHEDDAERAVRAGLELIAAVAGLRDEVGVPGLDMRVGVVTGEVAVTLGATGQGMVAGDAVNTAARVQTAAPPGQVWVDAITRGLAGRAITFDDVGGHAMKGKAEPIPLWAARAVIAGTGGEQRDDALEPPLVGRDRELRLLKELFHRTGEQGAPSLVILSGEPGVGKTRLGWEFEKYVDGLTATVKWHTGRCLAYGERIPYYALAEAIRARLRLVAAQAAGAGTADSQDAADAVLAALDPGNAGPNDGSQDMATLIDLALPLTVPEAAEREWIAPRLGALLGVGSLGEFSQVDLFAAWATFLRRVGDGADSVVWRIDDAEYADEGLLAFIEYLLASQFPVFIMLLTRPSLLEEQAGLARHPQSTLLNLAPLGAPEVQRLLDGLVAGLPDAVRDALVARSDGVPLYAVETVRSLVDRGLVVSVDGHLVLGDRDVDLTTIGAPASLQTLVSARLDALVDNDRRVVEAAAVLGQTFHRDHLAGMLASGDGLDEALARLQRGQWIVRETSRWSGDFGQYRFVQAVTRQVAYGMLSRRDRRDAHLRAVDLLSVGRDATGELAPIVAQHLAQAAAAVPDAPDAPALRARAIDELGRAADRAASLGAHQEAAAHLATASTLTDDPLTAAQLALRRGQALNRAFLFSAACDVLAPLAAIFDEAGDEVAAAVAAGVAARAGVQLGRMQDVEGLVCRWDALKDRPDADDGVVELVSGIWAVESEGWWDRTQGLDIRDLAERVVTIGLRRGDDGLLARGIQHMAWYYLGKNMRPLARILVEGSLQYNTDPASVMIDTTNLASHWMGDDLGVARRHIDAALTRAGQLGRSTLLEVIASNDAMIHFLTGDWDGAGQVRRNARVALERPVDAAALDLVDTSIAVARGEPVPAPAWSRNDLAEGTGWQRAMGWAVEVARGAGGEGTASALSAALTAFDEFAEGSGVSEDHALAWPALFQAARSLRDELSVAHLLAAIGDHDTDQSVMRCFKAHRSWALGLLAHDAGDLDVAASRLREAVRHHDAWQAGPYAARARGALGGVLLQAGDAKAAAEGAALLAGAREVLSALRANAWLAELDVPPAVVSGERADRAEVTA